jgi:DNA gyrase subunit A
MDVQTTGGGDQIVLATKKGMAIRFNEADARPMGRATEGVKGIALRKGDEVIGMVVLRPDATLLVVTEGGMGKRSEVDDYRLQKRGGFGVINMKLSEKTGKVVSIKAVVPDEELMLITRNGVVNRQAANEIRVIGRATQGVRLVALDEGDEIVDVARVVKEDGVDEVGELGEDAEIEGEEAAATVGEVEEEE